MAQPAADLAARLGLFDATFVAVGGVIGTAIILIPSTLIRTNPSPLAAVLVLAFAGLITFFGALAYAELGTMFPSAGGEYVYLRESWGRPWAFLCGWAYFVVTQTGGTATIVVGFASLAGSVVPLGDVGARLTAAGLLIVLTVVNYTGIRTGATTNNILGVLKLCGMVVIFVGAVAHPAVPHIDWSWPRHWTPAQFASALVPCLWAYEGWNLVPFVAGEIRKPERVLPRALALGLGIIVVVYLAYLWTYFRALPIGRIAASDAVASDAAVSLLGPVGGLLFTITMLLSFAGCANAGVLGPPRVYFAMARDGLFFKNFAQVHPVFRTPGHALWWQCGWGVILAVSGSYDRLLSYCTFGSWIFYAMTVAGLLLLRKTRPDFPRPYRMGGYPWTAIGFLAVACGFVASTLITAPLTSLAGLGLIAAGLPLYYFFRRRYHTG